MSLQETKLEFILTKSDVLPSDKVLCCLAIDPDIPQRVKAIGEMAERNGGTDFRGQVR